MAISTLVMTAAMDGARALLPQPADVAGDYPGFRILACAAVIKVGLLASSTAQEAFGFKRGWGFRPDRMAKYGVTDEHIAQLAQALVVANLPSARRTLTNWDDIKTARLRQLVKDRYSASEIADIMGVSRGAVCAKCDREGLKLQGVKGANQHNLAARARARAANAAWAPKPKLPARPRRRLSAPALGPQIMTENARPWMERESGQCAWPYTLEDGALMSCCLPTEVPNAKRWQYCPAHMREMFRAPGAKSEPYNGRGPLNFVSDKQAA